MVSRRDFGKLAGAFTLAALLRPDSYATRAQDMFPQPPDDTLEWKMQSSRIFTVSATPQNSYIWPAHIKYDDDSLGLGSMTFIRSQRMYHDGSFRHIYEAVSASHLFITSDGKTIKELDVLKPMEAQFRFLLNPQNERSDLCQVIFYTKDPSDSFSAIEDNDYNVMDPIVPGEFVWLMGYPMMYNDAGNPSLWNKTAFYGRIEEIYNGLFLAQLLIDNFPNSEITYDQFRGMSGGGVVGFNLQNSKATIRGAAPITGFLETYEAIRPKPLPDSTIFYHNWGTDVNYLQTSNFQTPTGIDLPYSEELFRNHVPYVIK